MKQIVYYTLLGLFALSYGCVPPNNEVLTEINLDLKDKFLQKIYTYQDKGQTDSLLTILSDKDPTYRYAAAMAFGSHQDERALGNLAGLLNDNVEEVRAAAAYAIGQIGKQSGEGILIRAFRSNDTLGVSQNSNKAILEAIGKCGSEQSLKNISTVKTYAEKDTALLAGQAWSIYRFALRGMTAPEGTQRMLELAGNPKYPEQVRFIAANYLHRAKIPPLDSTQVFSIINRIGEEDDPRIRMALATAIGKSKSDLALLALENVYDKERDYRVKCNILRTLDNFEYIKTQSLAFRTLTDKNIKVAQTAAQHFKDNGVPQEAYVYWRKAKDSLDWPVKMTMYAAANRHMSPAYTDYKWLINNDLKKMIADTTLNIYQRGEAFKALAEYPRNYKFIYDNGFKADSPILRTAATEAIALICRDPQFNIKMGASRNRVKKILSTYLSETINEGDAGTRAIAAGVLSEAKLGFKDFYENSSFLHIAKRDLKLPQETETYYAIQKAIDLFDGEKTEQSPPKYNHPTDWSVLEGLSNTGNALIRTSQGNIVIQFLPMSAPSSVANFIKLATDGFFNGKNFHRVVPNFVIQGGCPRGDGYGGLNYSIRSELPDLKYDKGGYVGMASAGKNTECTQWFITHSPTPHLDGKYTIFAKVTEGMDVVHKINVGDLINNVVVNY